MDVVFSFMPAIYTKDQPYIYTLYVTKLLWR